MKLEAILYEKFGYDTFRLGQREIITDLLNGKNVVAMLPTGGGKSICYQIPGYILEGTIIVISPLLSLMEDQVSQLRLIGEKRVVAFNSFRTIDEKKEVLRNIERYKFVFASPEMFRSPFFVQALKRTRISLFVVDEAHCISQWGYDFRPDYQKLHHIIAELGRPPVLAVTATATNDMLRDIVDSLQLDDVALHLYPIDRPNLALKVERIETVEEKKSRLLTYIKGLQGPGIIYCSSRYWSEALADYLRSEGIDGVSYYHGGMEQEDRMLIQQQFINNQLRIISSTSAFGMGINKPNIRYVLHFHYPTNLESYLQEIGRAGRDGRSSIAILLFSSADHDLPISIIQEELPSKDRISYFLSLLKEKAAESAVLQIEDAEFIGRNIVGLTEQHWRFLQFQFEEMHIIREAGLVLANLNLETEETVYNKVLERLNKKYEKLHIMRTWLQGQCCRRQRILQLFDNEKTKNPKNCCDFCGIDMSDYKQSEIKQLVPLKDWKTELQLLLGMRERSGHEKT